MKILNAPEGKENSKKVLEVDEGKGARAIRQGGTSSLVAVRDGEDLDGPAVGMRTALVVDSGLLDGGRDYVEHERDGTAMRADEPPSCR